MSKIEDTCKICDEHLTSKFDRNLVDSHGNFNPSSEIALLKFQVGNSEYLCKKCKKLLQKRCKLRQNIVDLDDELRKSVKNPHHFEPSGNILSESMIISPISSPTNSCSDIHMSSLNIISPLTSPTSSSSSFTFERTPKRIKLSSSVSVQTNLHFPVNIENETKVYITVKYPSCEKYKTLDKELNKLGIYS